jgi:hypothetical protein
VVENPVLIPSDPEAAYLFHDFSKDLVRNVRWNEKHKPGINCGQRLWRKEAVKAPWEILGFESQDACEIAADEAVEEVKQCLKDCGTPYCMTCDQPINVLAQRQGFDGVVPLSEQGDWNSYGCVAFKEPLADRADKEIKPYQYLDNDKDVMMCLNVRSLK